MDTAAYELKLPASMKKIFAANPHTKVIAAALLLSCTVGIANSAGAAQLQEARVTQVVNDVKLLLEQAAPRPATITDLVRHGTAVRTGTQSRSELTFSDLTITRLGANTIFSFKEGTREMTLIDGAILFQVPKGSGGATIRTVGVTAAITGTTGIAEFHPATSTHPQVSKWLCLEGTFHLYLPNGQSLELGPGKMATADGKSFSKVATFNIAKLTSTSLFFTGFDQPLASMNLIMLESQNQVAGLVASTTNPLDPTRIVNVTSQAVVAEETPAPSVAPTVSPTVPPPPPTPSKFGTPSVISSPIPYLVTNGTVITTDPSITTNGGTDYGKIYRGQTEDGAFSLWAFGSTSAFDTALRIDNIFFADPNHLPIAVFKFESLSLTGDPTIDTTNGMTKLGLIGVDGITSGPPGGMLKFTGLDLLLLATVNGSINLTSNVSFQDLHELAMYARGLGSDLRVNSPISNIAILALVAEDSIHLSNPGTMSVGKFDAISGGDLVLQIGGSLLFNGRVRLDAIILPGASVDNSVNLTLNVTGDYTNNSATESSRFAITNRDHIGGDASLAVGATNISTANNLDVQIVNAGGGHIGENALINIGASNDINITGDATFQILNSGGGHIGGNAHILVTTGARGGDVTADSILAFVNNHDAGAIDSGANISFELGGALITNGDATFGISNLNDGNGGGTIGSSATVDISAASISVGGFFHTVVSTNGGGRIEGDAINSVLTAFDLTARQGILLDIADTIFGSTGNFTGGRIDGNAIVRLNAENITTLSSNSGIPGTDVMAIEASIYPNASGTVGGDAIVDVFASNNISAPGDVLFWIANGNYLGLGGGTIGGDARVNVSAFRLSTGDLFVQILNYGGASIGGDAAIDLTAHTLSVGGNLDSKIDNSSSGRIGGNATINMNLSGSAAVARDATFQILGSDGAESAAINFNGGNYNVGGTFLSYIDGNGTITFNNASSHADVLKAGVFGANGVLNIGGGTLSADSTLKLYAPGRNGQLNFISNVTLGGNSVKILAANSITIFNNVVVTIGGSKPADVYTGFTGEIPNANYTGFGGNGSTTGTFGGAGANDPQPIANAPPFNSTNHLTSSGKPGAGGKAGPVTINVSSSDDLLALLDDVHPGRDGRIRIADSKRGSHARAASRSNSAAEATAHHRAMDRRTASAPAVRRSPQ